jgi:putative flippase GtrA
MMAKLYQRHRNFILYGIIGGISAGLDFGIYTLLVHYGLNILFANIISIHCGIFCSFLLNRYINFKVKNKAGLRFLSFYAVGLLGLAISSGMLYLCVDYLMWDKIFSKLLTVIVVAITQFLLNKHITFKIKPNGR